MNIDKIEKLDKFPSFLYYIKNELIDFGAYLILALAIFYILSISIFVAIITFLIYLYMLFKLDKNIFNAFQNRKQIKNKEKIK